MSLYTIDFGSDYESDSGKEKIPPSRITNAQKPEIVENVQVFPTFSNPIKNTTLDNTRNEVQIEPNESMNVIERPQYVSARVINSIPPTPLTIFTITRENSFKISGRRIYFRFNRETNCIFSAKCKSKGSEKIPIVSGSEVHLRNPSDTVLIVGNNGTDFSLRERSQTGKELLTVRYYPKSIGTNSFRRMVITFFQKTEEMPQKLRSKTPTFTNDGVAIHDFEGRYSIASVKNAVLAEEESLPNLLMIRKIAKDAADIEARFPIDPVYLFGIGISSFLCSLIEK